MIIKIEAVPKLTEDGKEVLMDEKTKQPVWDRERAFITSKDGKYQRVVTLTDELAAEVVKETDTSMPSKRMANFTSQVR